MEDQVFVALEGGVGLADLVELGDEGGDGVGVGVVPGAELVFFAVEVFFAGGLTGGWGGGAAFEELVGGAVDAVVGAEGGGEDDALLEDGAAGGEVFDLELGVEDVGGVGPDVAAEEVGDGWVGDLGEVVGELSLAGAPGEVGVGLGEAGFGEGVGDVGAGKGFGEEDGVRGDTEDFGDAPLPEGESLGVGVVDAEDADAVPGPEEEDVAEGVPEAAPVGGLEVERVDVLVFLRGVFGVLDGAVGAVKEPGGVLGDPGVVGGALEGDV